MISDRPGLQKSIEKVHGLLRLLLRKENVYSISAVLNYNPVKNKIGLIPFIFFITSPSLAQQPTERQQVQQVLHVIFEAFSEGSVAKMEQALTPDVKILETGEVWTLDTIRSYFARPRPADFRRINTLDFFQTEVEGKMAFVSYHNTAAIHANGKDRIVKWLESAVLVREGKSWRVKMLHSTRLKPD